MAEKTDSLDLTVVRLFEKLANWISISDNVAPALATLVLEHYKTGRRLSTEEISRITGYSRANIGLIMGVLEDAGIVNGERDVTQSGRGRKRILYTIEGDISSLFQFGVKMKIAQLEEIEKIISMLAPSKMGRDQNVKKLLTDLQEQVEKYLECLKELSEK